MHKQYINSILSDKILPYVEIETFNGIKPFMCFVCIVQVFSYRMIFTSSHFDVMHKIHLEVDITTIPSPIQVCCKKSEFLGEKYANTFCFSYKITLDSMHYSHSWYFRDLMFSLSLFGKLTLDK